MLLYADLVRILPKPVENNWKYLRMSSPQEHYDEELSLGLMFPDAAQAEVVLELQHLYEVLQVASTDKPKKSLFNRWLKSDENTASSKKGLYIWGGVGRGKTHLCDMFYKSVDNEQKLRMHYHRFMLLVHSELRKLGNVSDPIDKICASWAKKVRLLVLDEMHINDITDAMLMRHLLGGLFNRGVVLVTTSNRPPDDLYLDGLQREQFLPAIELMKTHTEVLNLNSDQDYRLRALEHTQTYLTPIDDTVQPRMDASFEEISGHDHEQLKTGTVIINDREIPIIKRAAGVIWFEFDELCDSNRSNSDYIEITNYFSTVFISNVPVMNKSCEDAARRFVNMIDEFYDHGTKLIMSAQAIVEDIYTGERLEFEFERAVSRLQEMQSTEYLAKERVYE